MTCFLCTNYCTWQVFCKSCDFEYNLCNVMCAHSSHVQPRLPPQLGPCLRHWWPYLWQSLRVRLRRLLVSRWRHKLSHTALYITHCHFLVHVTQTVHRFTYHHHVFNFVHVKFEESVILVTTCCIFPRPSLRGYSIGYSDDKRYQQLNQSYSDWSRVIVYRKKNGLAIAKVGQCCKYIICAHNATCKATNQPA